MWRLHVALAVLVFAVLSGWSLRSSISDWWKWRQQQSAVRSATSANEQEAVAMEAVEATSDDIDAAIASHHLDARMDPVVECLRRATLERRSATCKLPNEVPAAQMQPAD